MSEREFTLDDFCLQLTRLREAGLLPQAGEQGWWPDPEAVKQMIGAMTEEERRDPSLIDQGRRRQIAAASGTEPGAVEQLLVQFRQTQAAVKAVQRRVDEWRRRWGGTGG
jgi:signal recognition particle subunit SRP54